MKYPNIRIEYDNLSLGDPLGRVFRANGKLYRGIHRGYESQIMDFLKSDLYKKLSSEQLLIDTSVSNDTFQEYSLILEHKELPQVYHYEWSFSMLKQACLLVLKIQNICASHGYTLKDAHLGNILFDGNTPKWIDLPSIIPQTHSKWGAHAEYTYTALLPLVIWAYGDYFIARKLLEVSQFSPRTLPFAHAHNSSSLIRWIDQIPHHITTYINGTEILSISCPPLFGLTRRFLQVYGAAKRIFPFRIPTVKYAPSEDLDKLRKFICRLSLPSLRSTWSNYGTHKLKNPYDLERFNSIISIIETFDDVNSIIDLAGNSGYLASLIAAKYNTRIINCDYDSNAIDNGFINNSSATLHFSLHNFMSPIDASSGKRMRSDVVLALAVSHHLILSQNFHLDAILDRISLYTRKYVLVEFMPLGLWDGTSPTNVPEWYNLDWFQASFEKYFSILSIHKLELNRILLVGMIK